LATFEFLRLSLSVPPLAALDSSGSAEPQENRQSFIETVFSQRRDFYRGATLFSYVPVPSEALPAGILAGFIGKPSSAKLKAGPEEIFAQISLKDWNASFVVVDANEGAQVVAFEQRTNVGASLAIIETLFAAVVRERKSFSWHTDVEYITSTKAFKDAAKEYRGRITTLSFTFYPANGLRGFDKFKEFDKLAKKQTNSELSSYSLKNSAGNVDPTGGFVKDAVEYANEGAGRTIMKSGKNIVYDSRRSKKTKTVPESIMPREGDLIKAAGAAIILHAKDGSGNND
jgi:hypothetical protein